MLHCAILISVRIVFVRIGHFFERVFHWSCGKLNCSAFMGLGLYFVVVLEIVCFTCM